jgi:Tfp pilus assembly protein PilW
MNKGGLTLLEILISVAVLVLIVSVITSIFLSFDKHQALERDVSKVISTLEKAKALTLFSREASQYGVHIEASQITLFKGSTYQVGASDNRLTGLHSKVSISGYTLNGGGDDIVFDRLTGETSQDGTITLMSKIDSSQTKTITIEKTGLVR